MKNIIFVHLESINNLTFKMQSQLFPHLYRIADESICFRNYYSSATSTLMVLTDLMYGSMYRNEGSINLHDGYYEMQGMETIFDCLKNTFGYQTGAILWPSLWENEKIINRKMIGKDLFFKVFSNYAQYKSSIENFLKGSSPFALYVGYFATHTEYLKYGRKRNADTMEQWKDTRMMLDELCGEIIGWLRQEQKLNDTIIVFYGDHGDDFWGHRINNGYTHAIEPYSNLINTPLIMYIPEYKGIHVRDELISTIDIKNIILDLVEKDGHDIVGFKKRDYVFSRNLYAGQKTRHLSLEKGYAVTDGEYLLLVTGRGMELYNSVLDPQNTCNILEFFNMDEKGDIIYNSRFSEVKSDHHKYFFRALEIKHVIEQYEALKNVLLEEVQEIYCAGKISPESVAKELAFCTINGRHGYRFYHRKIVNWIDNKWK